MLFKRQEYSNFIINFSLLFSQFSRVGGEDEKEIPKITKSSIKNEWSFRGNFQVVSYGSLIIIKLINQDGLPYL